jgi:hypothetical protein
LKQGEREAEVLQKRQTIIIEKEHEREERESGKVVYQEFHVVRMRSLQVNSQEGARANGYF